MLPITPQGIDRCVLPITPRPHSSERAGIEPAMVIKPRLFSKQLALPVAIAPKSMPCKLKKLLIHTQDLNLQWTVYETVALPLGEYVSFFDQGTATHRQGFEP